MPISTTGDFKKKTEAKYKDDTNSVPIFFID